MVFGFESCIVHQKVYTVNYLTKEKRKNTGKVPQFYVTEHHEAYKGRVFLCNHKYKHDKVCQTPHLTEEEIKVIFVKAVNQYLSEKSVLLANADEICRIAGDTASLEARCDALTAEMNALPEQTENLITENASVAMDQAVYAERYGKLVGEYKAKNEEFDQLQSEIADKSYNLHCVVLDQKALS